MTSDFMNETCWFDFSCLCPIKAQSGPSLGLLCISSLYCMLFLLRWPPCQWSDMTSVEVSWCAYGSLHIRNIWLFVYNLCKPDMFICCTSLFHHLTKHVKLLIHKMLWWHRQHFVQRYILQIIKEKGAFKIKYAGPVLLMINKKIM